MYIYFETVLGYAMQTDVYRRYNANQVSLEVAGTRVGWVGLGGPRKKMKRFFTILSNATGFSIYEYMCSVRNLLQNHRIRAALPKQCLLYYLNKYRLTQSCSTN